MSLVFIFAGNCSLCPSNISFLFCFWGKFLNIKFRLNEETHFTTNQNHTTYVQSEQRAKTNWFKFKCSKADTANIAMLRMDRIDMCLRLCIFRLPSDTHVQHKRRVWKRARARSNCFIFFFVVVVVGLFAHLYSQSQRSLSLVFFLSLSHGFAPSLLVSLCFEFLIRIRSQWIICTAVLSCDFQTQFMWRIKKKNDSYVLLSAHGGLCFGMVYTWENACYSMVHHRIPNTHAKYCKGLFVLIYLLTYLFAQ